MIKKLLEKLVYIYLFCVGFGWVSFHIYFRLIRETKGYPLVELQTHLTDLQSFFLKSFVLFHLILILNGLLTLYRIKYNKQPSKRFITIANKLSLLVDYIYRKPLLYLYDLIAADIPGSGRFFIYLEKLWTSKQYGKRYFYTLMGLFDILPKLLLSLIFFVDIVIFGQMKYFLYSLWLILIPLLFSIFIKLIIDFSLRNIPVVQSLFSEIKGLEPRYNNKNELVGYNKYEYRVKPEYASTENAEENMNILLQLQRIQRYGIQLKEDIAYFAIYILLITSSIYLISGIVRLYLIFFSIPH